MNSEGTTELSSGSHHENGQFSAVAKGSLSMDSRPPSFWAIHKLRAIVDAPSPAESPTLLAAVRDVQAIFRRENTAAARRSLRPELELQAIDCSQAVLAAFEPAHRALLEIQEEVSIMHADVASLSQKLAAARLGASDVVTQTSALRSQLESASHKERIAEAFVNRFTLRSDEKDRLAGDVVDAKFLVALARLERIHDESRALLRCRNQRAGLEALEYAATTRENAYEKVFRFVQTRSGTLDVDAEEQEEEAALLRNAIRALRARPMLLRYCAEEVGSARRASLVARFVNALTKGGPGGVPRPIEIHAHDPLRYTNDMLAWIHQALASEKELIFRLFASTSDPSRPTRERAFPDKDAELTSGLIVDERLREHNDDLAQKVLNTVFDALCRPFRIRFEQALEQQLPVVVLYRLASLLDFYARTVSQLLSSAAAFPEMLLECNSVAMYAFFSAWKSKMESFRLSGLLPSEELTPPIAVHQSMTRLDEIMATLDASLTPRDARQGQIGAILEVILSPLLSLCKSMSSKSLPVLESHIFLANCIEAMRTPLSAYSIAADRVQSLTLVADEHIDEYIRLASAAVLRRCGLAERVHVLADAKAARLSMTDFGVDESGSDAGNHNEDNFDAEKHEKQKRAMRPLSHQPGMDVESLSIAIKNFYATLFGGSGMGAIEALSPPSVNKITNIRARSRAKESVARSIANAHADIITAVQDPSNEYQESDIAAIGFRDCEKVATVIMGDV